MPFASMGAAEYRALDADAFAARRSVVIEELTNGESTVPTEQLRSEVAIIEDEVERRNAAISLRSRSIAEVAGGAGRVIERTAGNAAVENRSADRFDTAEYRNAFMEYICRGTAIPMELRAGDYGTVASDAALANATTLSTGVSPQVPTTMQREIVQAMREYGTIWNEVRKIAVQGGVWFRIVDIVPTATWLTENNVSNWQKVTNDEKITFSFFELECRMAQSLLASAVTFDDFQAMFVPAVAEAMVTAIEAAIMKGNGTSQPLGILNDPRVLNAKLNPHDPRKTAVVEMTKEEFADWQKWRSKFKSQVPSKYRNGKIYMAYSTFDCYVETMADGNRAPVSIGYNPVTGNESAAMCGFPVEKVNDAILPDFDTASPGDVVAIYGNMKDYLVNTQPGMPLTTKRWVDEDTNTDKIKSLVALDGKVLNPYGFILIKKKASA